MWGLSIVVFGVLSYTYLQMMTYLEKIERFLLPILILIIILLCWVILSIWYEKHLEMLIQMENKKKKMLRIYICIVLVLLTLIGYAYVEKKDHDEWYRTIVEAHNQESY